MASVPKLRPVLVTAAVITSYITFALVSVNLGWGPHFWVHWLRSWLVAYLLAVPSLLFVAPAIRHHFD